MLKLSVVVNCSRGVTGTRSEQLAETWTFGDYAQYKYSQPFAETVCGSELQQRRHRHSVGTTVLKRGRSVIVQLAEAWTFGYCAQYKYSQPFAETVCGSELQQRRHRHSVRTTGRNVDFRLLYNWPKRGLSVIVQLAEAWTFGDYAQYKYSQPFAETVCGSELC